MNEKLVRAKSISKFSHRIKLFHKVHVRQTFTINTCSGVKKTTNTFDTVWLEHFVCCYFFFIIVIFVIFGNNKCHSILIYMPALLKLFAYQMNTMGIKVQLNYKMALFASFTVLLCIFFFGLIRKTVIEF